MRKIIILLIMGSIFSSFLVISQKNKKESYPQLTAKFWNVEAIDTVKFSRDTAAQHLNNQEFDIEIEQQVSKIASTGATHIALGTPYDEKFVPFLERWVSISRKFGLKIWFRGNFSGWEHWFGYPDVDTKTHKLLLEKFIVNNENLFEDGDIFTSCTECENGALGDPRQTGRVQEFREFLVEEHKISKNAFNIISKKVESGYYPMNYDVANLIMDRETTEALGGIVVIDHYVSTPEQTSEDASTLSKKTNGKILIGEFGAPIPDIHGDMTQEQQSDWINRTLMLLYKNPDVVGINYWTAFGGSTRLWSDSGRERLAVQMLKKYFDPKTVKGIVVDETGEPIKGATVSTMNRNTITNDAGQFVLPYLDEIEISIFAEGYISKNKTYNILNTDMTLVMIKEHPETLYRFRKMIRDRIFPNIQ